MNQSTVETPTGASRPPSRAPRVLAMILGLVLVLIGLLALAWAVGRSTDTVNETFSGEIDELTIEVNGRVSLEAGDTTEVTVEREWIVAGAPDVDMTEDGGTLRISAQCGIFRFGCQTHVTATAPADARVVVETAAGNVTVTGFESGVDLTTSAGNVVVTDVAGPATLRSSAGRIEGDITDGNVDAETSAGRIELEVRGEFDRLAAVTSAGNVDLTVPDDIYRVDADTSAGNINTNVSTDPDASREIVARSSAGSINIERSAG